LKRYALTLKIPLVLFSLLALVIILLGWRLSIGPIALDWAGDYLKRALVLNQKDVSFDFRDAVLVWRKKEAADYGRTSGLQVTFYEVEIIDKKTDFI